MFTMFPTSKSLTALQPSITLTKARPHCIYYYSKREQKGYIILTPFFQDANKCFKYDIEQNKWIHFTTYPDGLVPKCHTATIDEENDLLYITHGFNNIFAIFNMNTNKWNVMNAKKHNIVSDIDNARSCILPNSELHILGKPGMHSSHIRYDNSQKKFVTASTNGIENNCYLSRSKLIFVNHKNWLMALGGFQNQAVKKIWYANYTGHNQKEYVWKAFPLQLPYTYPICTVAFGIVIITHHNNDKTPSMWMLDCGDDEYKWIKPILNEKEYPKKVDSLIVTKDNDLHFVNPGSKLHSKVHLSKFIPSHIYNKYVNKNDNINKENDNDMKCGQCDELKDKVKITEKEKQNLQSLVDDLLNNQSKLQIEKKQLLNDQIALKQQYESKIITMKENYQQQIDKLRKEKNKYKDNESSFLQKIRIIEAENGRLMEECKESKMELNAVKQELNKLKRQNIDTTKYLEWTSDEFIDWIMTLEEAKFVKYENKLRSVFIEEDVNGEAIPFIDKSEWKNWGIASFMDRTVLDKHIKNLINPNQYNNNNNNNNNNYDEGNNGTAYI